MRYVHRPEDPAKMIYAMFNIESEVFQKKQQGPVQPRIFYLEKAMLKAKHQNGNIEKGSEEKVKPAVKQCEINVLQCFPKRIKLMSPPIAEHNFCANKHGVKWNGEQQEYGFP